MVSSMRLMSESCFSFLEKEGFKALIGLRAMDLTLDSRISKGFKIFSAFLLEPVQREEKHEENQNGSHYVKNALVDKELSEGNA